MTGGHALPASGLGPSLSAPVCIRQAAPGPNSPARLPPPTPSLAQDGCTPCRSRCQGKKKMCLPLHKRPRCEAGQRWRSAYLIKFLVLMRGALTPAPMMLEPVMAIPQAAPMTEKVIAIEMPRTPHMYGEVSVR